MKRVFSACVRILFCGIFCLGFCSQVFAQACSTCGAITSFTVNLSANPDTTWSVSSTRNGQCCQGSGSDKCVVFYVTVSPRASEIKFVYRNGSANNGVYEINCDPTTASSPGNSQCLGGLTTFCLTYCNPGNANDMYTITTSSGFAAGSDITLRNGCTGKLTISGLLESSLNWTSVYPGAVGAYNSYLSCTSACDTTFITPGAGAPAYIDYKVCGSRTGCTNGMYCDTQRVYTVGQLLVSHTPVSPVICAGSPNITLTENPSGGSAPYTYSWSNGSTNQSVSVPAGTYIVAVSDATAGCAAVNDTIVVASQPAATSNAGADAAICSGSNYQLSGSIDGSATAGLWTSSGTGSFSGASTMTATYFPSAADISAGSVTLTLTTSGPCAPVSDAMVLTINAAAVASAGADASICAGSTYTLSGSRSGGATSSNWTSSGTGTFNDATLTAATYTPSAADITAGTVALIISTNDPAGPCSAARDTMVLTITTAPASNAGTDQTVCANNSIVNLNGIITVAAGGLWTTSGTGTFSPSTTTLNALYTPSVADILSGNLTLTLTTTGNGGCAAVNDAMNILITPAPVVNAGPDQSVCSNNANVVLNGSVTVATGATWSSSGSGSFSPNNSTLNATYIPSSSDKTSGNVTLTLNSTGNGNCVAVSDAMTITITSPPTANAGVDQIVCGNNANVSLNGSVTGASGGQWMTTGTGTFSPNGSTLNATYIPGAADISSGSVNLLLITTGNGGCIPVSDTMHVTITPAPTSNAGSDQSICLGGTIILNGSVTVASGGTWSGGSGIYNPNNNTLNASYTPSIAEQSAGSVILSLTTTGNGTCNAVADNMLLTITDTITVNAGADRVVCSNNASVSLNGSVSGGTTTGQWSSSGSGSFSPNNAALNATYIPSAADKAAGSVTLTLTSTGNGGCTAVIDGMIVTITPTPIVNAGIDQTVCANNASVSLNGSVTIASGGQWTTSGTGTFSNDINLSTTYFPSSSDKASGIVTLTLTSTGNGNCIAVSDQLQVTITPAPTANAGSDVSVCINNPNVTLSGSVSVASGGTWSTLGSGTFSPNNTTLNATYIPSNADTTAGSVNLILLTTGNGNCTAVNDTMTISFFSHPTVFAGNDQSVCGNNANALLSGSSTTGSGSWTTNGTGTFFPNNTFLNATYLASSVDTSIGIVNLTLMSTNNGGCVAVTDEVDITISDAPTVNAGVNQTVCANNANVNLNGSVAIASGGTWTTSGTGTFLSDTSLNTTYFPSSSDKTSGLVTLTLTSSGNANCAFESDQMQVTITPSPVANAGADKSVCINNPNVGLIGSVSIATGGQWTTMGSGTFSPNSTTLNTTYIPSNADTAAGSVKIILTTTGNGNCNAVSDTMTVTFSPQPVAAAGVDQIVCANNANVLLNGSSSTGSGTWSSSGTGTFTPNNYSFNATYHPSITDTSNGNVILTMTSTNNAGCIAVTDQMNVNITDAPVANASIDQSVCANNALVTLNGSFTTPSTGAMWTTSGSGSFSPNTTSMNASYLPGITDTANGNVTIYLVTTGNGLCNSVMDSMTIVYSNAPSVSAGSDAYVCLGAPNYLLNGTSSTGSGVWTTLGSGTFSPSNAVLNATYIPGSADTASGTVTLILTSANNGSCNPTADTLTINYTDIPIVDAGTNQVVCANNGNVLLNGTSSTGLGSWTTNGDGTFFPNASTLNATYIPGVNDTGNGTVALTITSVNGCIPVSQNITVTITDAPVVNAGADRFICMNNPVVQLNGIVSGGATTGRWNSPGAGIFSPNDSTLNATYTPDSVDIAGGSVVLVLTSTGNGNCNAVTDSFLVNFTPSPIVMAGADIYICNGSMITTLNGSVSGGATTGHWSTTGTGIFSPDANTLNASYLLSAADTAAGTVHLILSSTNSGNCIDITDTLSVNVTAPPVTFAGSDVSVCANNSSLQLNGTVVSSTGTGRWTTSGNGMFIPGDTSLNAVYVPSVSDISTGNVMLTLSATNACLTAPDDLTLTITPSPAVNAGPDAFICSGTMIVSMNGTIEGGATKGKWTTTGSGFFFPNDSTLNATYLLSSPDSLSGNFQLILSSTDNGNCFPESDTMIVTITSVPATSVGNDTTVCANTSDVAIVGLVSGGSGTGQWTSSGTGSFSPSDTSLNSIYHPSSADFSAGFVRLVLSSTYACLITTDTMTLAFAPAPFADAGIDVTVCSGDSASLNGLVNNATGGLWTTSGTGSFSPDDTSMLSSYIPSQADIISGNISLTLTTTGNGICLAASDVKAATILSPVVADAGSDTSICASTTSFQLNGIASGLGVTQWSTSGSGVFIPDDSTLNATYQPSSTDTVSGNVTLTLSLNNACFSASDSQSLAFINTPSADIGNNMIICKGDSVVLYGSVNDANSWQWLTSGDGYFLPNDSTLNPTYYPGQWDISQGTISLGLIAGGSCGGVIDHMALSIVSSATTSAGNDTAICASANLQLNGTTAGGSTTQWTTSGTGTFLPDDATMNAVYVPGGADTVAGNVQLIFSSVNACFTTSDTLNVQFISTPIINAGTDLAICEGDSALLNGIITGTSNFHWTAVGTGSFVPNDSVANATYVPSQADVGVGSVVLYLSSDLNGTCGVTTDSMLVGISAHLIVDAGNDTAVCTSATIQLNGSSNVSASCQWSSSGTGTFNPDNLSLNAVYQPSAADTIAGNVTLTLSGSNACFTSSDSVNVSFLVTPSVDAGNDQTICAGDSLDLNGTSSVSSGLHWITTGSGIFFPNDSSISVTYIPSAADITLGSVELAVSASSNGCGAASDTMVLSITSSPGVISGSDTSICTGSNVQLNGSVNGTSSYHWTSTGNGTFIPNDSIVNPVYQPAQSDTTSTLLILTASNSCFSASDTMNISILGMPTVNAGADHAICAGDSISLNAFATAATSIQWSSAGTGSFIPNDSSLNATYIPGNGEISSGSSALMLTVANACMSVIDTVNVTITSVPTAIAGNDQSVCTGIHINLNGMISNGSGEHWTASGNGTFIPNDSSLNAMYVPGTSDSTSGLVTIVLNPLSGSCGAVADTLQVIIQQNPVASFTYTPACAGGVTGFTDASTIANGNIISWSWDFGSDTSDVEDPDITFASAGSQAVSLVVTTDAGCSDTIVQAVYVNPNPVALFTSVAACGDSVLFTDASSVVTGNISSWSWNFGDFNSSTAEHPLHVYDSPGDYVTILIVTTDSGCAATFTDSVNANDCEEDDIYQDPVLPTAFTPNADGHNDIFYVRGGPFTELDLRVYNEWGNEIFHGTTQAEGWDGTFKGEPQPGGKYIWTLKGISIHKDEMKLAGQIMLIR